MAIKEETIKHIDELKEKLEATKKELIETEKKKISRLSHEFWWN